MATVTPSVSDTRQPAALSPPAALGAVDPLGVTALRVPERITSRDPESASTEVAQRLSAHSLSVTGSPAAFEAHLAAGDAGPVRLLELGFGTDIRLQRGPVDDYIGIVIPLSGWLRCGWPGRRSSRSRTGR